MTPKFRLCFSKIDCFLNYRFSRNEVEYQNPRMVLLQGEIVLLGGPEKVFLDSLEKNPAPIQLSTLGQHWQNWQSYLAGGFYTSFVGFPIDLIMMLVQPRKVLSTVFDFS